MYEIQQQTQSMLLKHWTKGIMFSTLYILVHLKMAYLNINWREKGWNQIWNRHFILWVLFSKFQTLRIIDNFKLTFYVLYKSLNRKVTQKNFFCSFNILAHVTKLSAELLCKFWSRIKQIQYLLLLTPLTNSDYKTLSFNW